MPARKYTVKACKMLIFSRHHSFVYGSEKNLCRATPTMIRLVLKRGTKSSWSKWNVNKILTFTEFWVDKCTICDSSTIQCTLHLRFSDFPKFWFNVLMVRFIYMRILAAWWKFLYLRLLFRSPIDSVFSSAS